MTYKHILLKSRNLIYNALYLKRSVLHNIYSSAIKWQIMANWAKFNFRRELELLHRVAKQTSNIHDNLNEEKKFTVTV